MTTALLETDAANRLFEEGESEPGGARGRVTLEERLDAAWHSLRANDDTECPVCRQRLRLERSHGACEGCGSRLA